MFPPPKSPAGSLPPLPPGFDLGPPPGGPAGPPMPPMGGPPPLPVGASLPSDLDGDELQSQSPLMAALAAAFGGGQGATDLNVGTGDPQMGAQDLLSLLALGGAGVGGAPGMAAGGSGVPQLPTNPGMAMGVGY